MPPKRDHASSPSMSGRTVAARQGVDEHVIGQLVGRQFGGVLVGLLGRVGHQYQRVVAQRGSPGGEDHPQAVVVVEVAVSTVAQLGLGRPLLPRDADRLGVQRLHLEHRRRINRSDVYELAPYS